MRSTIDPVRVMTMSDALSFYTSAVKGTLGVVGALIVIFGGCLLWAFASIGPPAIGYMWLNGLTWDATWSAWDGGLVVGLSLAWIVLVWAPVSIALAPYYSNVVDRVMGYE